MSLGTPSQVCAIDLHYAGASIERLGYVAGAADPDIKQTRVRYCC